MSGADHPEHLGRYEIRKVLGQGAMGVVYLGHDPRIDRPVALKTIRSDALQNPKQREEFMGRFFREARAAGKLNHPGIVTVYEADEDEGSGISYIAMEYVEGADLSQFLAQQGTMAPGLILKLMRQLLQALDYAHAKGTVHRDIKPSNVLLERSGDVKLLDFGIARLSASDMTQTGQFLGTPGYMSPEQLRGQEVDGRSDLFSVGVVLYQTLTGKKPFESEDFATTCYQILSVDPPPPRELRASLPAGIDAVLRKALAKQPGERYQSGSEFLRDLEHALAGRIPAADSVVLDGGTMMAGPGAASAGAATPEGTAIVGSAAAAAATPLATHTPSPPAAKRRIPWVAVVATLAVAGAVSGAAWWFATRLPDPLQGASKDLQVVDRSGGPSPHSETPAGSEIGEQDPRREEPVAPTEPEVETPEPEMPPPEPERMPEPTGEPTARNSPAPKPTPAPAPRPAAVPPPPPAATASVTVPLTVQVYHRLSGGVLVAYVDEQKVLTHRFKGHLKLRKTNFSVKLDVPTGERKLRLTIAPKSDWAKVLSGQTVRTFHTGRSYRLSAKVGSLGRDLELDWQ